MNQDFVERLINAACTAVGVALCSTLNVYLIAAGIFMVAMSFPDCLGHFNSFEFSMDDEVPVGMAPEHDLDA